MIRAIHIEDEHSNIALLDTFAKKHCADLVKIEGSATNIADALALIKKLDPQLVYLDIELGAENAFELLDRAGSFGFHVIFITAYNEYALRAFKYNAIDYLLKPIDTDELRKATERAVKRIESPTGNESILDFIRQLKINERQKIGVKVSDGVLFINIEEIIRAEAKGSYTVLYLTDNKMITTVQNLKYFEDNLPASFFVRVHHSWIINTRYLKKYYRGKNGYLEMDDGSIVNISIRKKGKFLDFLDDEI